MVFSDVEVNLVLGMGIVTRKDFSQLKGQKIFLACEKTSPILKSTSAAFGNK
ncbi:hypothetical protein ALQ46_01981 [Pseudomonas savastanoi pv. phaseolicola]|nr:hypothetical protein ALQ46_01981 [Pseudomonas savastanoi pv. phaseolicola]